MTNDANAHPSLTLAERIADTLAVNGVRRMFGVPGGGSSLDLIDAAADRGIEFIVPHGNRGRDHGCRHRRTNGYPGRRADRIGPGAASVVNGIAYASLERAPVGIHGRTRQTATAPPHQILTNRPCLTDLQSAGTIITVGATSLSACSS